MKIGKFNIKKSWLIVVIIILLVVGYYVVKAFSKSPTDGLTTEKIVKGVVLQEVSETGSVKATEDISLGFKSIGKIARVNVAVGDNVTKGTVLAELDVSQTASQLQSARAALDAAKNQYDKLINGLTPEDLKAYENAVTSAQHDLDGAYAGALNTLNDAYSDMYSAYTVATSVQNSYFFGSMDQETLKVSDARNDINVNMQDAKTYIDNALKPSSTNSDIDLAIKHVSIALGNVFDDIKTIREQCEQGIYFSKVSSTDKTSLDTQKTTINTDATSVTTLQNNISSYKIALQKAQDSLASKTANARPEDIEIYKSQIDQAQANVNALQSQLNDNYLVSPIDGIITEINIKKGQVVSPSQAAINMLSTKPFEIKVYIYEQDIVNVKVGNDVKIDLVAFPRQTFEGKVMSIDPAETIVDNVVYYEVTIEFPNQPVGIRSGMTADITVETNKKEATLRVPKNAVTQIDGTEKVEVVKNKKIESVDITTGLEGNDYYEVLSGLAEGDEVVTGKK